MVFQWWLTISRDGALISISAPKPTSLTDFDPAAVSRRFCPRTASASAPLATPWAVVHFLGGGGGGAARDRGASLVRALLAWAGFQHDLRTAEIRVAVSSPNEVSPPPPPPAIMHARSPRVQTAKRTMVMMALSLAITAGGILLCYLLLNVSPDPEGHKTMNALMFEKFADSWTLGGLPVGHAFGVGRPAQRGRAPLRGGADGLRGRPSGHGQHGHRLLAPPPLLRPLRAALHAQRRRADGRGLDPRAPLHEHQPLRGVPQGPPARTWPGWSSCTPSTCFSRSRSPSSG